MNYHKKISEHKSIEIDSGKKRNISFVFIFSYTTKCDHAGISLYIEFYKSFFGFNFYDHRHWDIEKNNWEK